MRPLDIRFLAIAFQILCAWSSRVIAAPDEQLIFQDDFHGKLGPGWSWVREHREAWRATDDGLQIRIEPGNMWGPQNDGKNVLVRPAPAQDANSSIEVSVTFQNQPTNQYEQVDLVWYFSDSNMVKLGEELVDGKLSIVMGREEQDKTRTIAIIPLNSFRVRLKLSAENGRIRGHFQTPDKTDWHLAGECDLPSASGLKPKIAFQCYQGAPDVEHWAHISQFRVARINRKTISAPPHQ